MSFLDVPPNAPAMVCLHVSRKERVANFVFVHTDGMVDLLCGHEDCDVDDPENLQIVALGTMFDSNPLLRNLEFLQLGYEAHLRPDGTWDVMRIPEEMN